MLTFTVVVSKQDFKLEQNLFMVSGDIGMQTSSLCACMRLINVVIIIELRSYFLFDIVVTKQEFKFIQRGR